MTYELRKTVGLTYSKISQTQDVSEQDDLNFDNATLNPNDKTIKKSWDELVSHNNL